jgi:hypothetical protein
MFHFQKDTLTNNLELEYIDNDTSGTIAGYDPHMRYKIVIKKYVKKRKYYKEKQR